MIDYRLMQVKNIAECSPFRSKVLQNSAILSAFIKLSFVISYSGFSLFANVCPKLPDFSLEWEAPLDKRWID